MLLAVLCLLPVQMLRRQTPEMALLLILTVVTVIIGRGIAIIISPLKRVAEVLSEVGIEQSYLSVLVKTLAVATTTKISANLCRDGGSQAMAGVVELLGTIVALVILLPLLVAVADLLKGIGGGF